MTTIVPKTNKKGKTWYYKYGYEKDPITNNFKRKYLGVATKKEYLNHKNKINKDRGKYCKICGKIKEKYADHQDFCRCPIADNVEKN